MMSLRTSPTGSSGKAEEPNPYAAILAESFGAQIDAEKPAPPKVAMTPRAAGGLNRKASLTRSVPPAGAGKA